MSTKPIYSDIKEAILDELGGFPDYLTEMSQWTGFLKIADR
jgi:hypothetical protein